MRFLLAGILAILPLTAQAESLVFMNDGEPDSEPVATLSDTENYCTSQSPEDEGGFCRNPYSRGSSTNFETLIGPSIHVQSPWGVILYDPRFLGIFEVNEAGAGKPGFTTDRYEAGGSTAKKFGRMAAATAGWSTHMYGSRN